MNRLVKPAFLERKKAGFTSLKYRVLGAKTQGIGWRTVKTDK